MHLDTSLARSVGIIHFIYALTLPIEYKVVGLMGSTIVTLLYRASYRASEIKAPMRIKLLYHLLFRYVGFWEVFILCTHGTIISLSSWIIMFIVTSCSYFGHAYIVLNTISPVIRYEYQLAIMGVLVAFIGLFINSVVFA